MVELSRLCGSPFFPIAAPAARKAGSRVIMLNVNLLIVQCLAYDVILSYHISLLMPLSIMVHGSWVMVHGWFNPPFKSQTECS